MNKSVNYSKEAVNELDDIWEYISNNLKNGKAANDTIQGIMDSVEVLKRFPESGAIWKLPNGDNSGYRFVVYKRYLTFYRFDTDRIYVDRIIYAGRNILRLL